MRQQQAEERLIWLLTTMRNLFALRDVERFVAAATDAFRELVGTDRAFFLLCEGEAKKLVPCCARGIGGLKIAAPEARVMTLAQQVLDARQPLVANDTAIEGSPRRISDAYARLVGCVPLIFEGAALGVLYTDGTGDKLQAQLRHVQLFGEISATALDNAKTFERASNDLLTGLPNKSSFLSHLTQGLRDSARGTFGGIVLLDLDTFKRVNKAAGVDQGDRALVDVAQTLRDVLSADGPVARFGSDKFGVLLLPRASTIPIAVRLWDVAERARAALHTKVYHAVQLSTCIGGAGFEGGAETSAHDVLAIAERLLDRARSRGPGQVEIDGDTAR